MEPISRQGSDQDPSIFSFGFTDDGELELKANSVKPSLLQYLPVAQFIFLLRKKKF